MSSALVPESVLDNTQDVKNPVQNSSPTPWVKRCVMCAYMGGVQESPVSLPAPCCHDFLSPSGGTAHLGGGGDGPPGDLGGRLNSGGGGVAWNQPLHHKLPSWTKVSLMGALHGAGPALWMQGARTCSAII